MWQCKQKNPSFPVCSSSPLLQPHLAWHLTVGRYLIPRNRAKYLIWLIIQTLFCSNAHYQPVCIFHFFRYVKIKIIRTLNRFLGSEWKYSKCFLGVTGVNCNCLFLFQLKMCCVEKFKPWELLPYLCFCTITTFSEMSVWQNLTVCGQDWFLCRSCSLHTFVSYYWRYAYLWC